MRRLRGVLSLVTVALAGAGLVACGGGDSEEDALRDVISEAVAAWNAGDAEKFASYWTDDGIMAEFEVSKEDFVGGENPLSQGKIDGRIIDFEKVGGNTATTLSEIVLINGPNEQIEHEREMWVKEGDDWKIDGTESELPVPLPSGVTPVAVDMAEFSYRYDAGQVSGGPRAFTVKNAGTQEHEMVLFSIPANVTVQQATQAISATEDPSQLPSGYSFAGFGFAPPGESSNVVFRKPLGGGHYMMMCFIPDGSETGPPHFTRGMVSDFTVR